MLSPERPVPSLGQGMSSANEHGLVCEELVFRHLQVEGRRSLAGAPGGIVVAAMAGAEPAVVVASIRQGHTACMAWVLSLSRSVTLHLVMGMPLQEDHMLVTIRPGQYCKQLQRKQAGCSQAMQLLPIARVSACNPPQASQAKDGPIDASM